MLRGVRTCPLLTIHTLSIASWSCCSVVVARSADATPEPRQVMYRETSPPGAGGYEVLYGDEVIGVVAPFRMSAGQFGSRWVATTPGRKRSGLYATRDAAAGWLIEEAQARH